MFVAVYQRVRDERSAVRKERKRQVALRAVADPEGAAQKRIAKNQGKRKQKQRKLVRMKRERDVVGSVGVGKKRKK